MFCIICFFQTFDFSSCDIIFQVLLYPHNFQGATLPTVFYKNVLCTYENQEQPETI